MNLRKGIVVATHPEDHSVDLVMADDGSRLVGVQVLTPSGSARTGTVNMPNVPESKDKWDVTKRNGQDMQAMVGFVGRNPVVVGFLYPQVNQVLQKDPKALYSRHQSDVDWSIDGDGNIQLTHPGGAYVRIGETPDHVSAAGKNADANAKFDRNTGRKVNVRIGLAGNAVVVTMTPDGEVKFKLESDFTIEAEGEALIKAPGGIMLDTPEARCTGNLTVDGALTYKGGMKGSGGGGAAAVIDGNVQVNGSGSVSGDWMTSGSNSNHHSH